MKCAFEIWLLFVWALFQTPGVYLLFPWYGMLHQCANTCTLRLRQTSTIFQTFLDVFSCENVSIRLTWWRHKMVTFSALLAICAGTSSVTGEFPAQRPMTRSFDVFFDLHLNKRLSKQSWSWWFETKSRPSWRHCIEISLKFVPQGPVNNIPTLVLIMAIVPSRRQAIIWTNGGILYWRTYAWLFVCVNIEALGWGRHSVAKMLSSSKDRCHTNLAMARGVIYPSGNLGFNDICTHWHMLSNWQPSKAIRAMNNRMSKTFWNRNARCTVFATRGPWSIQLNVSWIHWSRVMYICVY